MDAAHAHHEEHISSYGSYAKIWAALLFLTFLTVAVTHVDLQRFAIFTALLIATVKASLVLLYFMHVRYDLPLFKVMIAVTLFEYMIFIILTFSDYAYR